MENFSNTILKTFYTLYFTFKNKIIFSKPFNYVLLLKCNCFELKSRNSPPTPFFIYFFLEGGGGC